MTFLRNILKFIIQSSLLLTLVNGSGDDKENSNLHRNLNVKSLTIYSPLPCDPNSGVDFLYIIHTAPNHTELRNTLRNTWAAEIDNGIKTRRVFLIGRSNATLEESIKEEHHKFGDIFMYDKVDAYRNMTIKVIMKNNYQFIASTSIHASYI